MTRVKPTVTGVNSAAGTSVTIPPHSVGDLIIIFAYCDGSNVVPTKPSASGSVPAWVDIDAPGGANTNGCRTAYFWATGSSHTSGAWATTGLVAAVVRAVSTTTPIGGHATSSGTVANSASAPAITLTNSDGTSVIFEFYGHRTVTAWGAAPTGYSRQAATDTEVCCNTKDSTTSDGSIDQPATTSSSSGYASAVVELIGDDQYTDHDENINRTNAVVPSNASGCYATLIGAGGAGGAGADAFSTQAGGGGGGGGGRIDRVFIPKALLGSTFSVTRGKGGTAVTSNNGLAGSATVFTSGSVTLSANGGAGGAHGSSGTGGAGGTASATGVTATTRNGSIGGAGGTTSTGNGAAGTDNTNGAGAGGGGGAGAQGSARTGGKGGDSATKTGGAGGTGTTPAGNGSSPAAATAGNGGAGGGGGGSNNTSPAPGANGGLYGGGGGGGGGANWNANAVGIGGNGADGYSLIEWVTSSGTFFPFITAA